MAIHSLYIHLPWCVRKCPYCDFNSYPLGTNQIPEEIYIKQLIKNYKAIKEIWNVGELQTIYFGGGTPSLFSARSIEQILNEINKDTGIDTNAEISIEINPGTINKKKITALYSIVNRISFGVQSFNDNCLKNIGRIHNSNEAKESILLAQDAGITNINVDLMHGLPQQNTKIAITDLKTAIELNVPHISWYELTIEENTIFGNKLPNNLPNQDTLDEIEINGFSLLEALGYTHYEISAFCKKNQPCKHNLTYWNYDDYVGIGAGAHGKYTNSKKKTIERLFQEETPKRYLENNNFLFNLRTVPSKEIPFEYFLNQSRLFDHKINLSEYENKTFQSKQDLLKILEIAKKEELITINDEYIELTQFGHNFANHFLEMLLPN